MMHISLNHFLFLGAILFTIGVLGIFLNKKNVIIILMSIELILLSISINFVAFSSYLNDISGQVFVMFILTVAAAEAAIGLAILVVFYRNKSSISVEDINQMKG
tara:strand:+ start:612 stop:923 length:312 start_codon:yes stop_codon:yes gene_type:complete